MFCLKLSFSKISYHIETSQMILENKSINWFLHEMNEFVVKGISDYNHGRIMLTSLDTVLNFIILKNLSRLLLPITIAMSCALNL